MMAATSGRQALAASLLCILALAGTAFAGNAGAYKHAALVGTDEVSAQHIDSTVWDELSVASVAHLLNGASLALAEGAAIASGAPAKSDIELVGAVPVPLSSRLLRALITGDSPACGQELLGQLKEVASVLRNTKTGVMESHAQPLHTVIEQVFRWMTETGAVKLPEAPKNAEGCAMTDVKCVQAKVAEALAPGGPLAGAAEDMELCCYSREQLAEAAAGMSAVLGHLAGGHGEQMQAMHDALMMDHNDLMRLAVGDSAAQKAADVAAAETLAAPSLRRQLADFPFPMPPAFIMPTTYPAKLIVPMVFHVLVYKSGGGYGPANYVNSLAMAQRLLGTVNTFAAQTGITFAIQEVRSDPAKYPYLIQQNLDKWQECHPFLTPLTCLSDEFVSPNLVDYPKAINVFISTSNSPSAKNLVASGAYLPTLIIEKEDSYVWLAWNYFDVAGMNNPTMSEETARVFYRQTLGMLGLLYTYPYSYTTPPVVLTPCVDDGDNIADTPMVAAGANSLFGSAMTTYCLRQLWRGLNGVWQNIQRIGIPVNDMNAWADSCPTQPGYDELANFMTTSNPDCILSMGHLTATQLYNMHAALYTSNPYMYWWGLYYNSNPSAIGSPAPQPIQVPAVYPYCDRLKEPIDGCRCKENWIFTPTNGGDPVQASYCTQADATDPRWFCELASGCTAASGTTFDAGDYLYCSDNVVRSCAPLVFFSPPPFPPSPPPPRGAPDVCKSTANGCACKQNWLGTDKGLKNFCSTYPEEDTLVCELLDPTCEESLYVGKAIAACKPELTASQCAGLYIGTTFQTIPKPPSTPAPVTPSPSPATTPSPDGSRVPTPSSPAKAPKPSKSPKKAPAPAPEPEPSTPAKSPKPSKNPKKAPAPAPEPEPSTPAKAPKPSKTPKKAAPAPEPTPSPKKGGKSPKARHL